MFKQLQALAGTAGGGRGRRRRLGAVIHDRQRKIRNGQLKVSLTASTNDKPKFCANNAILQRSFGLPFRLGKFIIILAWQPAPQVFLSRNRNTKTLENIWLMIS